jgi:hypothetical protein
MVFILVSGTEFLISGVAPGDFRRGVIAAVDGHKMRFCGDQQQMTEQCALRDQRLPGSDYRA